MYIELFNGEKFPKAFTDRENNYYYNLYKNGDLLARDLLIRHNLRLVFTILWNNFNKVQYDKEDLFSIGIIGLIKGIDNYNVDRNTKLSFYIAKCISCEILKFLRKNNRYEDNSLISLDSVVYEDGNDVVLLGEVLDINDQALEEVFIEREIDKNNKRIINDVLNILSDRDKKIIMLYFGFYDGKLYKQREIAEMVGIGRAGVSRVIVSVLDKIKSRILFEDRCFDSFGDYKRKKI